MKCLFLFVTIFLVICSVNSHVTEFEENLIEDEQITTELNFETTTKSSKPVHKNSRYPRYFSQIHGALMVIGWLGLVACGQFVSHYLKCFYETRTLLGRSSWFQSHRAIMVAALVLMLLATLFVLLRIGGWSGAKTHPILGVVSLSLAFSQPIVAFFRPKPHTSQRLLFNAIHHFVGHASYIVSVVCIFYALDFRVVAKVKSQIKWTMVTLITVQCFLYLWMHYLSWKKSSKVNNKSASYGPNGFSNQVEESGDCDESKLKKDRHNVGKVVFWVFIFLTISLVSIIAVLVFQS